MVPECKNNIYNNMLLVICDASQTKTDWVVNFFDFTGLFNQMNKYNLLMDLIQYCSVKLAGVRINYGFFLSETRLDLYKFSTCGTSGMPLSTRCRMKTPGSYPCPQVVVGNGYATTPHPQGLAQSPVTSAASAGLT
jgi:hypothetical protein